MVRTGGMAQPVKYLPCQCEDLGSDFQHLRRRPAMITCLCNHHFGGRRREQGQETHRPWMRSRFETLSQNIRWTAIKEDIKRLISSFCMHVTHVPTHTHTWTNTTHSHIQIMTMIATHLFIACKFTACFHVSVSLYLYFHIFVSSWNDTWVESRLDIRAVLQGKMLLLRETWFT